MNAAIRTAIDQAGDAADAAVLWLEDDELAEAEANMPACWFDDESDDDTGRKATAHQGTTDTDRETEMAKNDTDTATTETAPTRFCLSGSGEAVTGKSKFRPGGDARLKGYLQRIARGNPRDEDLTMQALAEVFVANTEDGDAHTAVTDAVEAWDGEAADFDDETALHAHPAWVLATAINPAWGPKFIKPAPVRAPRKRSPKRISRKVGRWVKEGHAEGRGDEKVFVFEDAQGNEKRVPYASTAEVPAEEEGEGDA